MDRIRIANTALEVSPIGLGTSQFGTNIDKQISLAILDKWYAAGGNLIDTAHIYGASKSVDVSPSEAVIGEWLDKKGVRSEVVLCTKGGHPDMNPKNQKFGPPRLSPKDLEADLTHSLNSLKTSYIDVYFLHRDDPNISVSNILDWLEEKRKQGSIRYYGCSNWSLPRIKEADIYAKEKGYAGFCCNQLTASLGAFRAVYYKATNMMPFDPETQSFHEQTQMCVMAATSLNNGYFHKKLAGKKVPVFNELIYAGGKNKKILNKLKQLQEQGIPANSVMFHFIQNWGFPAVSLMTFSKVSQLEEMLRDIEIPVSEKDLQELRELRGNGLL